MSLLMLLLSKKVHTNLDFDLYYSSSSWMGLVWESWMLQSVRQPLGCLHQKTVDNTLDLEMNNSF